MTKGSERKKKKEGRTEGRMEIITGNGKEKKGG